VPKTYTLELPNEANSRPLKYTRVERREFEKAFRHFGLPGMREILFERVFPIKPDPTRDNKPYPTGGGDDEAQHKLIYLGLRGGGLPKHISEEKVSDWIDAAVQNGKPIIGFVATAVNAVLASGVLGYVYEHEAVTEEEPAQGEGKADSSPSSEP